MRYYLIALAITAVCSFTLAVYWRGIVNENNQYRDQIAAAELLIDAYKENDALAEKLAASSRQHYENMKAQHAKIDRLATDLAAGSLRAHLAAHVTEAPARAGSGMDYAASCSLNAAGRKAYIDLLTGIAQNESQLTACQDHIRLLEAQQ